MDGVSQPKLRRGEAVRTTRFAPTKWAAGGPPGWGVPDEASVFIETHASSGTPLGEPQSAAYWVR